jgi:hypothetical protein
MSPVWELTLTTIVTGLGSSHSYQAHSSGEHEQP